MVIKIAFLVIFMFSLRVSEIVSLSIQVFSTFQIFDYSHGQNIVIFFTWLIKQFVFYKKEEEEEDKQVVNCDCGAWIMTTKNGVQFSLCNCFAFCFPSFLWSSPTNVWDLCVHMYMHILLFYKRTLWFLWSGFTKYSWCFMHRTLDRKQKTKQPNNTWASNPVVVYQHSSVRRLWVQADGPTSTPHVVI